MDRPIIGFLSDFGSDSAAAVCRGVILSIARDAQIVDIDHGVRKFAIGDGAFLLWAALPWLPVGVHLAVVDPGVGTARRPIGLLVGRGDALIGPDNGLLMPAARRLGGIVESRELANPELMLERRSATFHGRDVFAPMAAHLAAGMPFEDVGPVVEARDLVDRQFPDPVVESDALEAVVLYVDSFGNARLGACPSDVPGGHPTPGALLDVGVVEPSGVRLLAGMPFEPTFGAVEAGALLLYEDSNGLLAIGVNQGSAAGSMGIAAGQRLWIRPSGT